MVKFLIGSTQCRAGVVPVARRSFLTVRIFEPDSDAYNKIYTPLKNLLGIYIYLMPLRNFYKFQNYDSTMRLQVNLVFDFLA